MAKNGWERRTFDKIDWQAMGRYMNTIPATKRTNVIKLVNNWQHDGHQIFLHSQGEESLACPACGLEEDHYHFIMCRADEMKVAHINQKKDFTKIHKKLRTAGS